MAIIECKDCGAEVSSHAKACIKCGAPIKRRLSAIEKAGVVMILLIAAFILIPRLNPDNAPQPVAATSQAADTGPSTAAQPGNIEAGDLLTRAMSGDAMAAVELRKAAKNGDPQAQYGLGHMYENGLGVSKDYAQAVNWYKSAAANPRIDKDSLFLSLSSIGDVFTKERNYGNAVEWYVLATKQTGLGSDQAAISRLVVAKTYAKAHNYAQAIKWYRLTAQQGTNGALMAEFPLGRMYVLGQGVPQSKVIAYALVNAVDQSGGKSPYTMGLEGEMSAAEINEAQALSARIAADPVKLGAIIEQYTESGHPTSYSFAAQSEAQIDH